MHKYKLIVFFLLSNLIASVSAKNKVIELETEGKTYDKLFLQVKQLYKDKTNLEGKCISEKKWIFNIPDSIAEKACFFEFRYKQKDDQISDFHQLVFLDIINSDTLYSYYVNFDINCDTIRLFSSFCKSEISNSSTLFENDSVGIGRWHKDFFMIKSISNQYLHEIIQKPFFSDFYSPNYPEKKYMDFLSEYASLIEQNTNSIYYLSRIASRISRYQSLDDIKKLYLLFSPTLKKSYFGKEIYNYYTSKENFLESSFINTSMPLWNEKKQESVIQDSSKYNLIIFAASWCAPCREEIPILRDIYNDLHQNLIVTYISIDKLSTVNSWKKLMQKENIPWRSLLALNDLEKIRNTYFVEKIPHNILVYPQNQRIEIIDIRNKEDKKKLYSLCGNSMKGFIQ